MRRGRDFWRQLSDEVDRGERIADVARRYHVQPRTLTWWRWKLGTLPRVEPRFLPVVVSRAHESADSKAVELCIRDVIIRVGSGTDVSYVAALVQALRS